MIKRLLCRMGIHNYRYFPVFLGDIVDINVECTRCRRRHPNQWWETLR